jgi:hypothetical protein
LIVAGGFHLGDERANLIKQPKEESAGDRFAAEKGFLLRTPGPKHSRGYSVDLTNKNEKSFSIAVAEKRCT